MEEELNKFIKEAKLAVLTKSEKAEMRAALEAHMGSAPRRSISHERPQPSPWLWLLSTKTAFAGALALVIIVGSLSFASQNAVPGDPLYATKLMGESVLDKLAIGEEARLSAKTTKAIERLVEADKLAEQDKLDPVKERQIEDSFTQISNETLAYIRSIERESPVHVALTETPPEIETVLIAENPAPADSQTFAATGAADEPVSSEDGPMLMGFTGPTDSPDQGAGSPGIDAPEDNKASLRSDNREPAPAELSALSAPQESPQQNRNASQIAENTVDKIEKDIKSEQKKEKINSIKNSFEQRLLDYKRSLEQRRNPPLRLIAQVDAILAQLHPDQTPSETLNATSTEETATTTPADNQNETSTSSPEEI